MRLGRNGNLQQELSFERRDRGSESESAVAAASVMQGEEPHYNNAIAV
jgi:hypothetical protein